jgi:hypothetical protein
MVSHILPTSRTAVRTHFHNIAFTDNLVLGLVAFSDMGSLIWLLVMRRRRKRLEVKDDEGGWNEKMEN